MSIKCGVAAALKHTYVHTMHQPLEVIFVVYL